MERQTNQKGAVQAVIDAAHAPLLPQEILERSQRTVPNLGIATVYRHLKRMVDTKKVRVVNLSGQPPRYEAIGESHHHHHFQCTSCQRVFALHECPANLASIAPKGFTVERHELTLYGKCEGCA
jgi:Fur family transcriptional regulator, ferric uptake regulator